MSIRMPLNLPVFVGAANPPNPQYASLLPNRFLEITPNPLLKLNNLEGRTLTKFNKDTVVLTIPELNLPRQCNAKSVCFDPGPPCDSDHPNPGKGIFTAISWTSCTMSAEICHVMECNPDGCIYYEYYEGRCRDSSCTQSRAKRA